MDKALIILSDNNKGKFIARGFSSAFRDLSYFVYEKKIYDLNLEEIVKISPNIIFIFWTDMSQIDVLQNFLQSYNSENTMFIHCSELLSDIAYDLKGKKNHFAFSIDSKNKKNRFFPSINSKDYKLKFNGYNYNITFAGNPAQKNRELILSKLIYTFGPINIFCRSYDFYKSVDEIHNQKFLDDYFLDLYRASYKGYVETQKELSLIYSSSKINIDLENENIKPLNYRCLEIMASGGFLISPFNKNIITHFEEGKELEVFYDVDDLIDKINFYLKNLNIAQLIAMKGKKNTVTNHSFHDRLKSMLKVVYGKNFSNR